MFLYIWLDGVLTESDDANPDFMKHLSEDPLDKDEDKDDKFVKSLYRYSYVCVWDSGIGTGGGATWSKITFLRSDSKIREGFSSLSFLPSMIWDDLFVNRLSDATGKMEFSLMGEGKFTKSMLDPNDGKETLS